MRVEWRTHALDQLADIYVSADSGGRDEIEAAVLRINAQLAADPWSVGEGRGTHERAWFSHPLVVRYFLPPGGGVVVYHAARLRPRQPGQNGNG